MQNPAATAAGHRAGSAEGAEGQAAHRPGGGAQLQYIQGLRFVAMAWIIAYHYLDRDGSAALVRFVDDRPLDLFTVISGFVTHFAYAHRTQLSGPCVFVLRRCSKLFFMYYFSLFLSLCLKLVWLGLRAAPSPQSSVW
jgi:peptidoglycan/LPS O-acetylase OafA/YrhL